MLTKEAKLTTKPNVHFQTPSKQGPLSAGCPGGVWFVRGVSRGSGLSGGCPGGCSALAALRYLGGMLS